MKKPRFLIKFKNESIDNALKQSGGFGKLFGSAESAINFALSEGYALNTFKIINIKMFECEETKDGVIK